MLTTIGWILLGFVAVSAAAVLIILLGLDRGILLYVEDKTDTTKNITSFPSTTRAAAIPTTDTLDLSLTTIGWIFLAGGALFALILVILMFVSPWTVLDHCRICAACAACPPACPAPCGCG